MVGLGLPRGFPCLFPVRQREHPLAGTIRRGGWVRNRLKAAKKDAIAVTSGRSIFDTCRA